MGERLSGREVEVHLLRNNGRTVQGANQVDDPQRLRKLLPDAVGASDGARTQLLQP